MDNQEKKYYWKCPECGTNQEVVSSFFSVEGESNEKCYRCGKRVHCNHPAKPENKKEGGVTAYLK